MFQKTPQGDDVSFKQSYGASGEQARAVKAGLEADIVALSLAPDVDELVAAGLVDAKWNKQSYKGMVTNSVVVFVVRDGNPKKIKSWNDLLRPDVDVVTPNPFTSGGARWNIMAAYGAWRKQRQDRQAGAGEPAEALQERRRPGHERARRPSTPSSAARATSCSRTRTRRLLPHAGPGPAVRDPEADDPDREPDRGRSRRAPNKETANAFLRFLRTPAAQQVFADNGYRPVVKSVLENETGRSSRCGPGEFTIDAARPRRLEEGAEALLRSEERASWRASSARSAAALAEVAVDRPRARRALRGTGPPRPCPSAS